MGFPSARSIATTRREPGNGQAVNNSSIRRMRARSLSLAAGGGRYRPRSGKAEQPALPADRQLGVVTLDELAAVRTHLPDLLAKKSRSTINCPDLGVQTLNLALVLARTLATGLEGPQRLFLKPASSRRKSGSDETW
jgi:hypothetical protein